MEKLVFLRNDEKELNKINSRGLSTIYLYYLEKGKPNSFDLPLFISDDGKGTLSVEVFKNIFFAFQCKIGHFADARIVSGNDGNESKYNVVRIEVDEKTPFTTENTWFLDYLNADKKALKRESSKTTKAKAEAKKAKAEAKKAEAEAKADDEWTVRATKELSKYLVSRFKVNTKDLNGLEDDLLKILRSIK